MPRLARLKPWLPFVLLCACRREPDRATTNPEAPRALYALDGVTTAPIAKRLCDALHVLPERRRAACCNTAPAPSAADECTRRLSAALRAQAVTLDEKAVDMCVAALERVYAGCEWVGPHAPAVPAACLGLVRGRLPPLSGCRSSLECADRRHCSGLTGEAGGSCGGPLDNGSECGGSGDRLAALLRQDDLDEQHPECEGHCERGRCAAPMSPGTPCTSSVQCDGQHHCARGRCQKGRWAQLGEECSSGACPPGLRCVRGRCAAPAATGAACEADIECSGACLRGDGGAHGRCGPDCIHR